MDNASRGRISSEAAEVYEDHFVRALFQAWTGPVLDLAGLGGNDRVLDVACGTGVLARAAAERVRSPAAIVGLDPNDAMLRIAQRIAPALSWRQGVAERIPFPADAFDVVLSQFGLMFFDDPVGGLREMWRVLRPGGRLVVAVWGPLDQCPGYAALVTMIARRFGDDAAAALCAPFRLGAASELTALFASAGIGGAAIEARSGAARFPSLRSWITADVKDWTLERWVDDRGLDALLAEANEALRSFRGTGGRVSFPICALLARARKPLARG